MPPEVIVALDEAYFEDGAYLPARMGMFDWVLRDHRSNDICPIDRQLFDLLHELAASAGVLPRYQIISGYRSPATNAMLAATTDGVSSQSLHMQGKAIDVRLEGVPTAQLREVALARQAASVSQLQRKARRNTASNRRNSERITKPPSSAWGAGPCCWRTLARC